MSEENGRGCWAAVWWFWIIFTLLLPLPLAAQESGGVGAAAVIAIIVFEFFMLALPTLIDDWERGRPRRQRARAIAREQATARRQQREEQQEVLQQKQEEHRRKRHERILQRQNEQSVRAARLEVETFYRVHESLLRDILPPALMRSELQASFPAHMAESEAWSVARDLIGRMQPLVNQERQKQRQSEQQAEEESSKRAEEIAGIDAKILACQERMTKLREADDNRDFASDEIDGLKQTVHKLKEQRKKLSRKTG